ncbi:MAG: protein kinase domain-containing protein [Myxococcota bacterium]
MVRPHPSAPPPPPPPNLRFGAYTLVDRIAVGGMAEVFRASEPRAAGDPRTVVIKRMLPHIAAHPDARAMFEEEARLGSIIEHRNVVDVLGRGEEHGHPYLALEYVPGVDLWRLGRWLGREDRALGVPLALLIVTELLAGLEAVHRARDSDDRSLGIVHRDVSPSNVLLSVHGDVKLADFGIAQQRFQESRGEVRPPHTAKGKLGYLSPEQVTGSEVGRASDVFSAAIVAAELLMGEPLFAGDGELDTLLAIRDADTRRFAAAARNLPPGLGEVVLHALARDPAQRIADAATFRERLLPFTSDLEAPLRRELGDLVGVAMGSEADRPDATPVHELPPSGGPPPPGSPYPDEPRAPGHIPPLRYQVRTADGAVLGAWPYSRVVQAVSTGKLGVADRVSVAGKAFRGLGEVPELRRHLRPSDMPPKVASGQRPDSPEQVSVHDGGIVRALVGSALRSDTGLWVCEQGAVRKEVFIRSGVPEYVTSNLASEMLGEHLVARGTLSRGELDMALAVMPRFDGRLGDTLVALGLVEPVQLFRHIADQVREKLLDLFGWDAGTATWHPDVPPPDNGFPLGLDPWRIVDEGVARWLTGPRGAETWTPGRRLVRVAELPTILEDARLPDALQIDLDGFQRPVPVEELGTGPGAPGAPQRRAVVLLHMGALRWDGDGA